MNKAQKILWTVYLGFWLYLIFFLDSYSKDEYIVGYLFLGWIPFLVAHIIWKDKNNHSGKKLEIKKSNLFSKINASLKSGWWNQPYTGERIMRETRALLLFLSILNLAYGLIELSTATNEDKIWSAYGILFISGLYLVASILKSFWFRFVCLILWVIDLLITLLLIQGGFTPVRVIFLFSGVIILQKMWQHRKEKMIQPPFRFSDFFGGNKIDLKQTSGVLLKVLGISVILSILLYLVVQLFS